jgi:2'-5' RNA ligase
MRLFVAVEFSEIGGYLVSLQEKLKETGVKMTFPKAFHITLKFLGEVDEKKVDNLKEVLKKVKFEPFKAKVKDIGVFPSETYIRVVWVGLEDGKHMAEIQKQVEDLMAKEGFKKEEREFVAHITIARIRVIKDENKKDFSEFVKNIKIKEKEVDIKNFKLIKSELTKTGAIYEDVEEFS